MATYDLEEQEQLSELKAWWNQYGNLITAVVMAAALAAVGWQGWNWYQARQAAEASALYGNVQRAMADRDAKKAREAAGELVEKYSGTTYAGLGALLAAKANHEAGDLKSARAQLAWAADNARSEELRDLARLRLAAVMVDEKAYDEALKQLQKEPAGFLAGRYAEQRGDILALQGKRAEAKAAYQAALARLDPKAKAGGGQDNPLAREMLQTKLDTLGEGA